MPGPIAFVWLYLAGMNLSGFLLMAADKRRAKRGVWRIPEHTLFAVALLGGSLGAWAGMYAFHHKTRHWYFVLGMPLLLLVQLGLAFWLYANFL